MGVSGCDCTFRGMCAFLEYFHGWVLVSVTVENAFMGGCTVLEHIYGWVWVFVTV